MKTYRRNPKGLFMLWQVTSQLYPISLFFSQMGPLLPSSVLELSLYISSPKEADITFSLPIHLIPESHESRQKVSTFTNEQKEEKERKTKKKNSPRQRQGGGYMSHFCCCLLGFLEMAEVQTKCHK
jgi:hypothetical protein